MRAIVVDKDYGSVTPQELDRVAQMTSNAAPRRNGMDTVKETKANDPIARTRQNSASPICMIIWCWSAGGSDFQSFFIVLSSYTKNRQPARRRRRSAATSPSRAGEYSISRSKTPS